MFTNMDLTISRTAHMPPMSRFESLLRQLAQRLGSRTIVQKYRGSSPALASLVVGSDLSQPAHPWPDGGPTVSGTENTQLHSPAIRTSCDPERQIAEKGRRTKTNKTNQKSLPRQILLTKWSKDQCPRELMVYERQRENVILTKRLLTL